MWGDERVNCVLLYTLCPVLVLYSRAHCFGWLCTAMQSNVLTVKHTDTAHSKTSHS
ncbi:unnamed protein product, partial [Staurois parvus]